MDLLSHFLAIIVFLSLIIYTAALKRSKAQNEEGRKIRPPMASGAWPLIGHLHLLGGRELISRALGAMADKYGPIYSIRLGSYETVVVSSWEMVKECFMANDKILATRPSMTVSRCFYDDAVFALAPYGPYWSEVRKIVNLELLTSHRLEMLRTARVAEVGCWIKDLYLKCMHNETDFRASVNMSAWFEHLTGNTSIKMLAGQRFSTVCGEISGAEELHLKKAIKKALFLGGIATVSDFIPWLKWMDFGGHVRAMKLTCKEIDRVIGKWLQEHIEKHRDFDTHDKADFMDVMLSKLAEGTNLYGHQRDDIIKATTLFLLMAATESMAETLIWALSLLLNNRHVLKSAQDELDIHVGRQKWAEESDINNLTYLQAIFKETLRLYPPGPIGGPREAMGDCYIGGYYVPKGTRLILNIWKLHRDPRVWSNPLEFRPERFMNAGTNFKFKGQNFEYIPFSSGRRMCPGLPFALQVIPLTLARLLQGFHVTTPKGKPVDMREGVSIALPKVEPLEVILTPRLPWELYQNL